MTQPLDDPSTGYGDHDLSVDLPAKAATCLTPGNTEVKKCSVCKKQFLESKDGLIEVTSEDMYTHTTDNARHSFKAEVAEVPATCQKTGTPAYIECSVCGQVFDPRVTGNEGIVSMSGSFKIADKVADITPLAKLDHKPVAVDMVKATPSTKGVKDHYKCEYNCGTLFEDPAGLSEITIDKLQFDWIEQGGPTPDAEDNADLKAKADADGYKVGFKSYDVTYQINDDNMTTPLRTPTAGDLSKMDIVLPFPDGITKADTSKYEFEVLHQKADGSIETVKFTVTNDGFKLSGLTELSPFAVAWKDAAKQSGSGTKTDTAKQTPAKGTSPKTGDETNIALWVVLFTVVLAAAVTTVIVAKKKIKSQN